VSTSPVAYNPMGLYPLALRADAGDDAELSNAALTFAARPYDTARSEKNRVNTPDT
jgi:hypothetical protein